MAILVWFSMIATGAGGSYDPLPAYELRAPILPSDVARDGYIVEATRRFWLIDKGRTLGASSRLRQVLATRPVLQWKRTKGGQLFVEVLVDLGGYAIISDALVGDYCTQLNPALEIPRNSYWYDKALWQVQLEILPKAEWSKRWKPLPLEKGKIAWTSWVNKRIGHPALSAAKRPKPRADSHSWGYEELAGGTNVVTGRNIVKAHIIAHKRQIADLQAYAEMLAVSYRRREARLESWFVAATTTPEYRGCENVRRSGKWKSGAQFDECQQLFSDVGTFEIAIRQHKAKRKATYRKIRLLRQRIEFHKRGLAEAERVLAKQQEKGK